MANRLLGQPALRRWMWLRLLLITLASVAVSLAVTPLVAQIFHARLDLETFEMGALVPLLVAPLVTYRFQRLSIRLMEQQALVRELSGLLPVCAWCRNVRDDAGYWQTIERFVSEHSHAQITHAICPDCLAKRFPEGQPPE
jgi:hypothetical protein